MPSSSESEFSSRSTAAVLPGQPRGGSSFVDSRGDGAGRPVTLAGWLSGHVAAFPLTLAVTLCLASVLNPIQPVTEERVSFGNPMLLMRLATAGLGWVLGLWGIVQMVSARRQLLTLPGVLLIGLVTILLGAAVLANEETKTISLACALILGGYLMLLASCISTLGIERTARATFLGSAIYLLIAWFVFLFFPSVGRFYEYTDATTTVTRMGGVAHPNAIAREAAVALVVFCGLLRFRGAGFRGAVGRNGAEDRSPPLSTISKVAIVGVLVLILATLVATISRTSVLAGAAGVAMLFFDKLYSRRGVLLAMCGAGVLLTGFIYSSATSRDSLNSSATALVTKSGDVEELTSLTGRTQIWSEAMELISRRPLTGYGLDSAASVMSKEAVGTHSLILHVIFSGGVVAGVFLAGLLFLTLGLAVFSKEPLFRGLATYVLVSGLVEDTLFESFPCQLTLLFIGMMFASGQSSVVKNHWK
ncbi:MAG: O-antigen ligase family protein [Planctomycetota bacterium]